MTDRSRRSPKPNPKPNQVRQDTDGEWYTRAEFMEYYGSTAEWEATRAVTIYKSLDGVT